MYVAAWLMIDESRIEKKNCNAMSKFFVIYITKPADKKKGEEEEKN